MAGEGREEAILETSVLVNFLKIDRTDLLASHPTYRFIVIDFVRDEVTRRYQAQLSRLHAAFGATHLLSDIPPETTTIDELAAFAAMEKLRIGQGERAAVAAAHARGLALAMDDERAWKRAAVFCASLRRENTVSLMVTLIKARVINVAEADCIKAEWEAKHKFKLLFGSFAERI